ncbi:MAG: hypothetical protein BroJett025_05570 [Patescibacteria group bacterium]|nr:MAG: hypothetical protein BroJett025_05570 [Patescibacteria group bacterium]
MKRLLGNRFEQELRRLENIEKQEQLRQQQVEHGERHKRIAEEKRIEKEKAREKAQIKKMVTEFRRKYPEIFEAIYLYIDPSISELKKISIWSKRTEWVSRQATIDEFESDWSGIDRKLKVTLFYDSESSRRHDWSSCDGVGESGHYTEYDDYLEIEPVKNGFIVRVVRQHYIGYEEEKGELVVQSEKKFNSSEGVVGFLATKKAEKIFKDRKRFA